MWRGSWHAADSVRRHGSTTTRHVRRCGVSRSNGAVLTGAAMLCAACDCTLLPLTYLLAGDIDLIGRSCIKCVGCGQRYQWNGAAGWTPDHAM